MLVPRYFSRTATLKTPAVSVVSCILLTVARASVHHNSHWSHHNAHKKGDQPGDFHQTVPYKQYHRYNGQLSAPEKLRYIIERGV